MPILLDGGLATALQARGLAPHTAAEDCSDEQIIESVQRAFVNAGSQILLTASFRSLPSVRADWEQTLDRGVSIAKRAALDRAQVWLSLGPGEGHALAVGRGAAAGIDGVVLETFVDPAEALAAVIAVRTVYSGPLVACLVPNVRGETRSGEPLAHTARALIRAGADGVGLNCMPGPAIAAAAARVPDTIQIWAKPNGGPDQAAAFAVLWGRCHWLGGCCGTDPEAIRALSQSA